MSLFTLCRQLLYLAVLGFTLLALPAEASASALDVTTPAAQPQSLTTWVALLEDPGANLTLADVQSPTVATRSQMRILPVRHLHWALPAQRTGCE